MQKLRQPSFLRHVKRHKKTAEIINKKIDIPFYIDKRIREINNGEAVWKTKEWAKANKNLMKSEHFYLDYREYKGGESWKEFYFRIANFMDEPEK